MPLTRKNAGGADVSDIYCKYYQSQRGSGSLPVFRGYGSLPVFRGDPIQQGKGLGDILRAVARFLIPIVSPIFGSAASKFITTTSDGINQGKSLKDSAKAAVSPTLSAGLSAAGDVAMERLGGKQGGSGRKRRKRTKEPSAKKAKFQSGAGRKPKPKMKPTNRPSALYKAKKSRARKVTRILPTNF